MSKSSEGFEDNKLRKGNVSYARRGSGSRSSQRRKQQRMKSMEDLNSPKPGRKGCRSSGGAVSAIRSAGE
jgi:hypothetical protein